MGWTIPIAPQPGHAKDQINLEDTINSAPGSVTPAKTVQAMRDQLNQDTQILASLDPNSEAYRRLSARIHRETDKMLDFEEQAKQQQRAHAAAAAAEQRRRDQATSFGGAVCFTVLGGVITYSAWGSWWILLGIAFVVIGLVGMFTKDPTST